MDGPYRDLGHGFARLTGAEAPRRAPSSVQCVEDALYELLRNSRDAGARKVFVASRLRSRRYRTLTVIDDGEGIPEQFTESVFDPGVTTRYLTPVTSTDGRTHGAGLALHNIRLAAEESRVVRPGSPTSIEVTFDTRRTPERALQTVRRPSTSRNSSSNLTATARDFALLHPELSLHVGSPATILASLIENHIIQVGTGASAGSGTAGSVREAGARVGIRVSGRTVTRILRGEVVAAERVSGERLLYPSPGNVLSDDRRASGVTLGLGESDRQDIAAILQRVAAASYLTLGDLDVKSGEGEITITARIIEPEDQYDGDDYG